MLIFGHRFINSERLYHIDDVEAVLRTPSNSLVYLSFSEQNLDVIEHLNSNSVRFALEVENIRDVIYAENLGASFILLKETLAKSAQKVAETYLFDAKILVHIEEESQIEMMAYEGIDGVVFANAIVKIST